MLRTHIKVNLIKPIIMEKSNILKEIIIKNSYIKKCQSSLDDGVSKESLSYLLSGSGIILTQSQKIKLGTALENCTRDIILNYAPHWSNIKPKNSKGIKEKDHLWRGNQDYNKNKIIYAEFKANLQLDTEKAPATAQKCLEIENELKEEYPDCLIEMYLVSGRYLTQDQIECRRDKFKSIEKNLIGIKDFLGKFNNETLKLDEFINDEDTHKEFIVNIAKTAFKSS